jgi:hypothetical protein
MELARQSSGWEQPTHPEQWIVTESNICESEMMGWNVTYLFCDAMIAKVQVY